MSTESKSSGENDPFAEIEARLEKLSTGLDAVASRLEIMQEEAQRSATQLHRLGLNQESAKLAGQRRDALLKEIGEALGQINEVLAASAKSD
ncbi:MAG: hypothetical protein AAGD92_12805 [Pseudomonadota bacterium]